MTSVARALVVLVALLGACAEDVTKISVSVSSPGVDGYQIRIREKVAFVVASPTLTLLVPDSMAGRPTYLEMWGIQGGTQVAYGRVAVTPVMHSSTFVEITLEPVSCGTLCVEGTVACGTSLDGVDGTLICAQADNGCLEWQPQSDCPASAPYCSNGVCGETCEDECGLGEAVCDGTAAVRACGQYDSDECMDWAPPAACGSGQACTGDACEGIDPDPDACAAVTCDSPPQPTCTSPTNLRTYAATGTCSGGTCTYTHTDKACACSNGACNESGDRLATGDDTACIVRDNGTLACWGDNQSIVAVPSGTFTHVSVGLHTACAIRTTKALVCWGSGLSGTQPTGTFTSVAVGATHACAIRTNGTIACWGSNSNGESSPPPGAFIELDAYWDSVCAVRADRSMACWGDYLPAPPSSPGAFSLNYGTGVYVDHDGTAHCFGSLENCENVPGPFAEIELGILWLCGLLTDGSIKCEGNLEPQLPEGTYSDIAAAEWYACARRTTGQIVCAGHEMPEALASPPSP